MGGKREKSMEESLIYIMLTELFFFIKRGEVDTQCIYSLKQKMSWLEMFKYLYSLVYNVILHLGEEMYIYLYIYSRIILLAISHDPSYRYSVTRGRAFRI